MWVSWSMVHHSGYQWRGILALKDHNRVNAMIVYTIVYTYVSIQNVKITLSTLGAHVRYTHSRFIIIIIMLILRPYFNITTIDCVLVFGFDIGWVECNSDNSWFVAMDNNTGFVKVNIGMCMKILWLCEWNSAWSKIVAFNRESDNKDEIGVFQGVMIILPEIEAAGKWCNVKFLVSWESLWIVIVTLVGRFAVSFKEILKGFTRTVPRMASNTLDFPTCHYLISFFDNLIYLLAQGQLLA